MDAAIAHWSAVHSGGSGAVDALQDVIEKAMVLGLAANRPKASPALSDLVSAYAITLAAQVRARGE